MPRLHALFFFLLASLATACPIKTGFVANGQMVDNTRLVPVCGTLPAEMKVLPEATTWSELFVFSRSATNNVKLISLKASIRRNGYTQFNEMKVNGEELYQFSKGNQYIVLSTFTYKGARFLRVAGN